MEERKRSGSNGGNGNGSAGGGEAKACASSSSSSPPSSYSPLSSLEVLLADPQGSELFEEWLESEGLLPQLHFLFAVDGLKTTVSSREPPQKLAQKIRSISKLADRLIGLSEATRTQIYSDQISLPPSVNIFDRARDEVESHMKINLLPNFLKSDIYLSNYLKLQTIIEESIIGAPAGAVGDAEDSESEIHVASGRSEDGLSSATEKSLESSSSSVPFHSSHQVAGGSSAMSSSQLKLTSSALAATRKARLDTVPQSRLLVHHHPRKPLSSGPPAINPYHASYSSYNPVSRQDSEIQSLSSADGKLPTSSGYLRKMEDRKGAGSSSSRIRRDLPSDCLPKVMKAEPAGAKGLPLPKSFNQEEFTRQLMGKLHLVVEEKKKKEQEQEEKLKNAIRPKEIASALRKIQSGWQVEAADDILDQHLNRVFADKTPIRSPPRYLVGQKTKKSNGGSRSKKIDTYSLDSGIEFKTPGYEINPSKKPLISKPKPGTSTTQEDSGISITSSTFTHAQHKVSEWQAGIPTKSSSMHHGLHNHQQQPFPSSTSASASLSAVAGPLPPKKPTTTTSPRYTIFALYSDGPESKSSEPYRFTSDVIPTLGQLKEKLPRRGNYRYFLKKESSELNMIVQEEVTRDDEYLSSVNGKIIVTLQQVPLPQQPQQPIL